jgi:probable phosphoglycerate mutase
MATRAATTSGRKDPQASARDSVPTTATAAADTTAAARPTRPPKAKPVPPTLIFFVRHGTTPTTGQVLPGRAPGLHLADQGRGEAEAVAENLARLTAPPTTTTTPAPAATNGAAPKAPTGTAPKAPTGTAPKGLTIAAVYASPLERARETAAPIGRRLGHKVAIEKGLIEMDFGEWTGAELKSLRKLPEWNAVQRYPSGFQFPGGEAFSAMRARIAATVAGLCQRHPGQAIVCVSHADVIKAAVSEALGTHLDLFQRIVISTCSVTAVSYSPTGPVVLAVNSTGDIRL